MYNNNSKSLNEQVSEILNSKSSKSVKRAELVKLNLTKYDIAILMDSLPKEVRTKAAIAFKDLTFGVEIECINCNRLSLINAGSSHNLEIQSEGYNHRDNNHYIKIVSDSSLRGENANEVVTHILNGKKGLDTLKSLCSSLSEIGATVNRTCGLHVHFGCTKMNNEWYVNIFKNYQMCKRVIDSFLAPSRRGESAMYCNGIARFDYDTCHTASDIREMMGSRYFCVNPESWARHKTIEFRHHQGSVDYKKISTWVEFLASLVIYSYSNRLSSEVASIDDIPFIKKSMKDYLKTRKAALNG